MNLLVLNKVHKQEAKVLLKTCNKLSYYISKFVCLWFFLKFFVTSFVKISSMTPPRQLGLKGSIFQGLMEVTLVITKFGEDQSKTLSVGGGVSRNFLVGVTTLPD